MGLTHVVITSVDRDDLDDGGARHFAEVIQAIRAATPATTIEILTPDFLRKDGALEIVVAARPDVFNHNLETVPSNYLTVRPGARYFHSIRLLQRVKELDPSIFTKSGIMVGLGEERNEVLQLMDDLRTRRCRLHDHRPVSAAVEEASSGEELRDARRVQVLRDDRPMPRASCWSASSPLTRSSHHAGEDFAKLRAARAAHARQRRLTTLFSCRNSRQRATSATRRSKMFALVADVEKYPEFLPLCERLTVRSRKERDGRTCSWPT